MSTVAAKNEEVYTSCTADPALAKGAAGPPGGWREAPDSVFRLRTSGAHPAGDTSVARSPVPLAGSNNLEVQ